MTQVQFIQVSPQELATLIQESVKQSLPTPPFPTIESKQKEILTRIETANLFSISLVCLHDWVKKAILKPYKVGNKTYFKRSEVMEVLSSSNKQN
ncbi:helix-turn-helix domain-containing protein [Aquirufa sp. A-Brett2-W8]